MIDRVTRLNFRPRHSNVVKARTRRFYMLLLEREFRHAVDLQAKDGTGADIFIDWAKSKTGRNVFKIAGVSHTDEAIANIKKCIIERAILDRIDLFGRRKGRDAAHIQLAA